MSFIRAEDLIQYALSALGGGYCYGSSGETCSLANRQKWATWNPSQADKLLGVCAKWDGRKVWDCSGLFRGAWRALYKYRSGGATTQFNTWCRKTGPISEMPEVPGLMVFWAKSGSQTSMSHVGIYLGGGYIIEARGSAYGVVKTTVAARKPTHYGVPTEVIYDYDFGEDTAMTHYVGTVKTAKTGYISIWNNVSKSKSLVRVYDGEQVEVLGACVSGTFAPAVAQGVQGYVDTQYLVGKVNLEPEVPNDPNAPSWGGQRGVFIPTDDPEALAALFEQAVVYDDADESEGVA